MIKRYCFLILLCCAKSICAQWNLSNQLTFGGSDEDKGFAMDTIPGGGFFLAGSCESEDGDAMLKHQYNDAWILKLTPQKTIDWQLKVGGFDLDEAKSVKALPDGGCIAAGWTDSSDSLMSGSHGSRDAWIARISKNGALLWIKLFGGSGMEAFNSVVQAPDGNFVALGFTDSQDGDIGFHHGGWDFWMVKTDTLGNLIWEKTLGGSNLDAGYDIIHTTDGGFLMTGQARSADGDASGYQGEWDVWLVKTDASGNIEWQKMMGGTGSDGAYKILATANSEYYVAAWTASADGDVTGHLGGVDAWIIKTDTYGNIQWQKNFGGSSYDLVCSLSLTHQGEIAGAGFSRSQDGDLSGNAGWDDAWIALWDTSGSKLWSRRVAGSLYDQFCDISAAPSGVLTVLGWTNSMDGDIPGTKGVEDVWLLTFDKNTGTDSPVLSRAFSCFPNPGSDALRLKSPIPSTFRLTDLSGNVQLLSPSGINQWEPDTRNLAPGIYLLQDTKNGFTCKWVKM
ncbi:MAG: T9SS type A sorting domain-containing protein [Bacteroidia bacterium]|nr:T9SS type A sorting domain-containing protein [Bacteroidia bacterium]